MLMLVAMQHKAPGTNICASAGSKIGVQESATVTVERIRLALYQPETPHGPYYWQGFSTVRLMGLIIMVLLMDLKT